MAVAGQLLIQIAADTKALKQGLDKGRQQVQSFSTHIKSLRSEMEFVNNAAKATGVALVVAWSTRAIRDYVGKMTDLHDESIKTGKSIEDLSKGAFTTEQVDKVVEMSLAFEKLADAAAAWAIDFSDATGVLDVARSTLIDNAALLAGVDSKRIESLMQSAKIEAAIARQQKEAADAQKKAYAARIKAAQEAAKIEAENLNKIQDVFHRLTDERDTLSRGANFVRDRNTRQYLEQAGALPHEIELAKRMQAEIDGLKKQEEARKRRLELDKWLQDREQQQAQFELDQAREAEEERKRRMEQAANIIDGRGGVSAIERGSQAAFSAANKQRNTVEMKQLGALQKIEKNTRSVATTTETLETVELV